MNHVQLGCSRPGMDYPDVTFVLQVGQMDRSKYIHPLGRTACAGKNGKGGLFLANYEVSIRTVG